MANNIAKVRNYTIQAAPGGYRDVFGSLVGDADIRRNLDKFLT